MYTLSSLRLIERRFSKAQHQIVSKLAITAVKEPPIPGWMFRSPLL